MRKEPDTPRQTGRNKTPYEKYMEERKRLMREGQAKRQRTRRFNRNR